jgi:hypothetical protein
MYIRTTSRKNKDGSVVRYVQLAHNERDPITGQSKAKILYNFGRLDELNMDGLRRLAVSIGRFLGDESIAPPDSNSSDAASLKLISSKSLGGAWLLNELWHKLGIGDAICRRLTDRQFRAPIERALFAMVANRALDPSSKLAVEEWVEHRVVIPDLPSFDVHHGYRAMDFLLESEESIQQEVFHAVADLLNLEVDLLFFDTTSTYFETEETEEDEFRQCGYSKDHRPDLPQVVIGFAVTRDGIPIRCWVWPGNTSDMSVVPEELAKLKELDGDAHTKAHCRLHNHPTYKRYLKMDKRGNLRIDQQAVKAMGHLDGKYLIQTSDDTLSAEDVALGYKQLLQVEAAFRTLKQSLELRPVYYRKEERIRSHVLLCWLALMLIRILENKTGKTWRELRNLMEQIHLVEYQSVDGTVRQRTELTSEHQAIVSALELPEPQKIWGISIK